MLNNRVAILATGDEIINGDILNTNVQYLARALTDVDLHAGMQMTASDTQTEIEEAIHFLLTKHKVIITMGGLGPTSDDRTRFAVGAVTNSHLEFHQPSWDALVARLTKLNLVIPESNKQQVLFPAGAQVFPNPNGTAAGCLLEWRDKIIIMLPGPPAECWPMIDNQVIPALLSRNLQQPVWRKSWLLLGVSEAAIAQQCEMFMLNSDCVIGYRASSPYLEVKLLANESNKLATLVEKITPLLQPYCVHENKKIASQQLKEFLLNFPKKIYMTDYATGGLLTSAIIEPNNYSKIIIDKPNELTENDLYVEIKGLEDYWQQASNLKSTEIQLILVTAVSRDVIAKSVLIRGQQTQYYAMEILCWELLRYLKQKWPQ